MAVQQYTYTDINGNAKSVGVNISYGVCAKTARNENTGRNTNYRQDWEMQITFQLSESVPVPLKVYLDQSAQHFYKTGEIKSEHKKIAYTIPRGQSVFRVTVICKIEFFNTGPTSATSSEYGYNMAPQPTGEVVADEGEQQQLDKGFTSGPIYVAEFYRTIGENEKIPCRIEILRRGYTAKTKIIEVFQQEPIVFTQVSRDTKGYNEYAVLNGMGAELNLVGQVPEEFKDLFTFQDADLRLDYYENERMYFQLYNVASVYEEDYPGKNYMISCGWSCGISMLRKIPFNFPEAEDADYHRYTQLEVIRYCLEQVSSTIDLYTCIYTYPDKMPMNTKNDPLASVEVDIRCYRDEDGPFSCARVLEEILSGYGARIGLSYHLLKVCWVIEEPNAKIYGLPYRIYKPDGSKAYSPAPPPVIPGRPDAGTRILLQVQGSGRKVQKEVLKSVVLEKNLEYIPELITDGDFRYSAWQDDGKELKNWTKNGEVIIGRAGYGTRDMGRTRTSYATSDVDYTLKIAGYRGENSGNNVSYIESKGVDVYIEGGNTFDLYLKFKPSFGIDGTFMEENPDANAELNAYVGQYTAMIFPVQVICGNYYLRTDKSWGTAASDFVTLTSTTYGGWSELVMSDVSIPDDGDLKIRLYAPLQPTYLDSQADNNPFFVEVDYVKGLYKPSGAFATTQETLIATSPANAKVEPFKMEIIHADVNTLQNVSALTVGGELTTLWNRYYAQTSTTESFAQTLARKILDNYISSDRWILSDFEFFENDTRLSWHRTMTLPDDNMKNRVFICTSYTYSPRKHERGTVSGTWVEVYDADAAVTFSLQESKNAGGSSGSSGGAGFGQQLTVENPFNINQYITAGIPADFLPVQIKDGKLGVDKTGLDTGQADTPTLDLVTQTGNRSFKNIEIGSVTNNLSLDYDSIKTTNPTLAIEAKTLITLGASDQPALTVKQNAVQVNKRNTGTPSTLATFTSDGTFVEAQPSAFIPVDGTTIIWSSGKLKAVAQSSGGTSDYNALSNRPIDNLTGNVKSFNGYAKFPDIVEAVPTYLAGFDSAGNLRKKTVGGIGLATESWVGSNYYTRSQSNARFGGGLTISGSALILEDGSGNALDSVILPSGGGGTIDAYTKAQANERFVNNVFITGSKLYTRFGDGDTYTYDLPTSGGGGGTTINGTPNYVPVFNANGNNIQNSHVFEGSGRLNVGVDLRVQPGYDLQIIKNFGVNRMMYLDANNTVQFTAMPSSGGGGSNPYPTGLFFNNGKLQIPMSSGSAINMDNDLDNFYYRKGDILYWNVGGSTYYQISPNWISSGGGQTMANSYLMFSAGGGIATNPPGTFNLQGVGTRWKLGGAASSSDLAVSRVITVEINGTQYQLYGRLKP